MQTSLQAFTKLGRPRAFDEERVLDAAMRVFWQFGYEGASLRALTQAMGIDRKSMYLAFGDKEALFRRALQRYASIQLAYLPQALSKLSLHEFVDELFEAALAFYTDRTHPRTCMSLHAFAVAEEAQSIRGLLAAWRGEVEDQYRRRFESARRKGELPKEARPAELARYLAVVMAGLAVQAADGATPAQLRRTADLFRSHMPFLAPQP